MELGRDARSGTGAAGGGAGKVSMQDFHFVMTVNKASPKLFLHCADGEHLKKATLTCRKAGKDQQEYLKVVKTEVLHRLRPTKPVAVGVLVWSRSTR